MDGGTPSDSPPIEHFSMDLPHPSTFVLNGGETGVRLPSVVGENTSMRYAMDYGRLGEPKSVTRERVTVPRRPLPTVPAPSETATIRSVPAECSIR
jgi:hypothetical protein